MRRFGILLLGLVLAIPVVILGTTGGALADRAGKRHRPVVRPERRTGAPGSDTTTRKREPTSRRAGKASGNVSRPADTGAQGRQFPSEGADSIRQRFGEILRSANFANRRPGDSLSRARLSLFSQVKGNARLRVGNLLNRSKAVARRVVPPSVRAFARRLINQHGGEARGLVAKISTNAAAIARFGEHAFVVNIYAPGQQLVASRVTSAQRLGAAIGQRFGFKSLALAQASF